MSKSHIIAFDAGGTSVKAAVYDEDGRECAVAGKTMAPLRPSPGHMERDPQAMWEAVTEVARRALADSGVAPSSIAAVGLTGYGNGLYLVDAAGAPTRNGVLSTDLRAQEIVARWRADGTEARVTPATFQHLWAGKPGPLIAWLAAEEPASLARAQRAMMCKDYLRFRLTGALANEVSELSSGGLIEQRLRRFTPTVLNELGLARYVRLFGETIEPLTVAGVLGAEAARATGLLAGTPVSAGYADGPAMAIALGAIDESLVSVVSGTWGLNQLATRAPVDDGSVHAPIVGPRPGEYVLTNAGPNSASAFEWFVNSVLGPAAAGGRDRQRLIELCDDLVARVDLGRDHPCFLPYLNGQLDAPRARGCFIGLASWHGLPEMVAALYEGVAFEHRGQLDRLLAGRTPPRAARFAGGAARSRPWLKIFAAALELPLELAATEELGALGAAIVAAVAVGLHPDLEAAVAAMTHVRERVEPDPALVSALAPRRKVFNALCDDLGARWASL
jgi:L-xylulokinase